MSANEEKFTTQSFEDTTLETCRLLIDDYRNKPKENNDSRDEYLFKLRHHLKEYKVNRDLYHLKYLLAQIYCTCIGDEWKATNVLGAIDDKFCKESYLFQHYDDEDLVKFAMDRKEHFKTGLLSLGFSKNLETTLKELYFHVASIVKSTYHRRLTMIQKIESENNHQVLISSNPTLCTILPLVFFENENHLGRLFRILNTLITNSKTISAEYLRSKDFTAALKAFVDLGILTLSESQFTIAMQHLSRLVENVTYQHFQRRTHNEAAALKKIIEEFLTTASRMACIIHNHQNTHGEAYNIPVLAKSWFFLKFRLLTPQEWSALDLLNPDFFGDNDDISASLINKTPELTIDHVSAINGFLEQDLKKPKAVDEPHTFHPTFSEITHNEQQNEPKAKRKKAKTRVVTTIEQNGWASSAASSSSRQKTKTKSSARVANEKDQEEAVFYKKEFSKRRIELYKRFQMITNLQQNHFTQTQAAQQLVSYNGNSNSMVANASESPDSQPKPDAEKSNPAERMDSSPHAFLFLNLPTIFFESSTHLTSLCSNGAEFIKPSVIDCLKKLNKQYPQILQNEDLFGLICRHAPELFKPEGMVCLIKLITDYPQIIENRNNFESLLIYGKELLKNNNIELLSHLTETPNEHFQVAITNLSQFIGRHQAASKQRITRIFQILKRITDNTANYIETSETVHTTIKTLQSSLSILAFPGTYTQYEQTLAPLLLLPSSLLVNPGFINELKEQFQRIDYAPTKKATQMIAAHANHFRGQNTALLLEFVARITDEEPDFVPALTQLGPGWWSKEGLNLYKKLFKDYGDTLISALPKTSAHVMLDDKKLISLKNEADATLAKLESNSVDKAKLALFKERNLALYLAPDLVTEEIINILLSLDSFFFEPKYIEQFNVLTDCAENKNDLEQLKSNVIPRLNENLKKDINISGFIIKFYAQYYLLNKMEKSAKRGKQKHLLQLLKDSQFLSWLGYAYISEENVNKLLSSDDWYESSGENKPTTVNTSKDTLAKIRENLTPNIRQKPKTHAPLNALLLGRNTHPRQNFNGNGRNHGQVEAASSSGNPRSFSVADFTPIVDAIEKDAENSVGSSPSKTSFFQPRSPNTAATNQNPRQESENPKRVNSKNTADEKGGTFKVFAKKIFNFG